MDTATCLLCKKYDNRNKFIYKVEIKPDKETDFNIPESEYVRYVYKCVSCGVYYNIQNILPDDLYESNYNAATYKNKLLKTYSRIMALGEEKSDNKHRVKRIINFLKSKKLNIEKSSVLDIGSGLCVFLGEFKKHGIYSACIDPDPLSVEHALNHVGVNEAYAGKLENFKSNKLFDLITFNKVLEHVIDPIPLLSKARKFLNENGYIYVELPDGENALQNGNVMNREEFYIEHFTVYNDKSIKYLANMAGLTCTGLRSIHEPSDKYTIYAFMKPKI